LGRVGLVTHRERHHGGFDIVHIKDSLGHQFATRSVAVVSALFLARLCIKLKVCCI